MKSFFNDSEAEKAIHATPTIPRDLAMRVYTSRLIGGDSNLVLHGGGNTSVKLKINDIFGEEREVIYVKGSGADLATIGPGEFTCLDLERVKKLRQLDTLSDEEMDNQLKLDKLDAAAPDPSVEALLHAFLPHKYIDHTHADSILVLTHQENGKSLVEEVLGAKVAVVPYFMSGLPLARSVIELYEARPDAEAIVILNHGIFTFGDDAETSYERMIEYVSRAESYINANVRASTSHADPGGSLPDDRVLARCAQVVRGACAYRDSEGTLQRFYTEPRSTEDTVEASLSSDAAELCLSGVLVPDHVIRTKNETVYLESVSEDDGELAQSVQRAVEVYRGRYGKYCDEQSSATGVAAERLDSAPRVFLIRGIGILALGLTRQEARVAADIAEHTVRAKCLARRLGGYVPISDSHAFEMEYWCLQQKKMTRAVAAPLKGKVAVVTGAAGAIGYGIADSLIAAGAVVVVADIDKTGLEKVRSILAERYGESSVESVSFDVIDLSSVEDAFSSISRRLGGVDVLVPNAGIAHVARIEELDPKKFESVVSVNLMGTFNVVKAAVPIFRRQGTGGNVVLVSSKNVFDPGAAFGAYSASKAAAHQIAKIAALELAELDVRVNMVNPDAVFGDGDVSSKLWDLIGPDRMKARGLSPEGLRDYYRQRNMLKVSVTAEHVGRAVVFFAGDDIPITGATLPVDGGVSGAFPR